MFNRGNERVRPFTRTESAALQRFHDVTRGVHGGDDDLQMLLGGIVRSVVEVTGFDGAALSLIRGDDALETAIAEGFEGRGTEDYDVVEARLESPAGELLGLLLVDRLRESGPPEPDDLRLLEMFATQAGLALHAAQGWADLTDRLRLGEIHRDVVRAATALDIELLASQIAHAGHDGMQADSTLVELNPADGVSGVKASYPDAGAALDEDLAAAAERLTLLAGESRPTWTNPDRSVVAVKLGAPMMGVLAVRRDQLPWTELEEQWLVRLGEDLGGAVHNAQLHHRERAAGQRLRTLDESTRRMIATVTHEMKNPLTSLNGHLEMLASDLGPSHLVPMQRSTGRLLGLVDSFLDSVHGGSGEQARTVDVVNLSRLVSAEVDSDELLAQCAGVTLRAVLPVAPVFVSGDVRALERLVTNLIGNALKFTPDGGTVTVQCHRKGESVLFRVTDTGIGISAADQRRLFERYFRSTNPAALAIEGTGLGLAIVSEVVAQHRGSIECRSVLGQGTTFEVRLPAATPVGESGS